MTGWVADARGQRATALQVTFFRNRPRVAEENPSAFAPRQLVFAHAALADPRRGTLVHDQRAARAGFGLAGADETSTRAWIDDWSLALVDDAYVARIAAREFALDLRFAPTQPLLPAWRRRAIRARVRHPRRRATTTAGRSSPATGTIAHRRHDALRHRHRVARSRMVERSDGAGSRRLGLDRDQSRRRRRADGVPDARRRGRNALGRRHAATRGRKRARVRRRTRSSSRRGDRGARRAPASPIRWR